MEELHGHPSQTYPSRLDPSEPLPPDLLQRRRDDTKNKILVFEEGGGLGAERQVLPKHCFSWETA